MTWHMLGNLILTVIALWVLVVAYVLLYAIGNDKADEAKARKFTRHVDSALEVTK